MEIITFPTQDAHSPRMRPCTVTAVAGAKGGIARRHREVLEKTEFLCVCTTRGRLWEGSRDWVTGKLVSVLSVLVAGGGGGAGRGKRVCGSSRWFRALGREQQGMSQKGKPTEASDAVPRRQ